MTRIRNNNNNSNSNKDYHGDLNQWKINNNKLFQKTG